MNPDPAPAPTRSGTPRLSGAGAIVAAAFALSSLLGLALLSVTGHWLTKDQNVQFLAVWSLLFGIGGALSAVDSESARLAARATLEHRPVSGQVARVGAIGVLGGLTILLAALAFPGVGPILRSSPAVLAGATAMVLLFVPLCLTRGVLLGTGKVTAYAGVVLGEALLRILLATALWLAWDSPPLFAAVAAIAVGGLAWVPAVRSVKRAVNWRSTDRSWPSAIRSVGALGSATGISTLLLAAYPVLVGTAAGTTRGLEVLFPAVILTRMPLIVVAPLQAVAVPWATRALHGGQRDMLRRLWAQAALALLGLVVVAGVSGWFIGPWALALWQGESYQAPASMMALLLAATCVLAVALPQMAVLVAAERHSQVTLAWAVGVLAAIAWLILGPGDAESRGTIAYVIGTILVYAVSSRALLSATKAHAV